MRKGVPCMHALLTEAKNLSEVETPKSGLGGATGLTKARIEGKIAEFEWYLMKHGYKLSTIQRYTGEMEILSRRGANIFEPESVMETIAEQKWKDTRKLGVATFTTPFSK